MDHTVELLLGVAGMVGIMLASSAPELTQNAMFSWCLVGALLAAIFSIATWAPEAGTRGKTFLGFSSMSFGAAFGPFSMEYLHLHYNWAISPWACMAVTSLVSFLGAFVVKDAGPVISRKLVGMVERFDAMAALARVFGIKTGAQIQQEIKAEKVLEKVELAKEVIKQVKVDSDIIQPGELR